MFKQKNNYYQLKKTLKKEDSRTVCCLSKNHKNIIYDEFLCHLPMAILSLSVCLFLVALLNEIMAFLTVKKLYQLFYLNLFHIAHYIHILCASFSSFYSCYGTQKNSSYKQILFYIFFALINSIIFCTLSDILLPFLGTLFFQNNVVMHICLFCKTDLINALFFSIFGILSGYALSRGDHEYSYKVAKKVHIGHIWFGCIASILYLFSQLDINISSHASSLFTILFISILAPCIFSDICLPFLIKQYTK